MKILLATEKPFAPEAVKIIRDIIESEGYQLEVLESYPGKKALLNAVADVDGLIVRSDIVDKDVFSSAHQLKLVVRAGAGYDNIDCNTASKKNIVVMNTPGQNSNAVAELAIGLMIYGARNFFSGKTGSELKDRHLGLHGYGHVAKNVFRISQSFGMKASVFTRFSKVEASSLGIGICDSPEELYSLSDILSIHLPASESTNKSINYELLKRLKNNALIINTSRKEIIDEEGLIALMEERKDIKYLSDIIPDSRAVFEEKFKGRYYFTPIKIGAQTNEANVNSGIAAAKQTVSFFKTGNEEFRVNF